MYSLILGTRGSALALAQTDLSETALRAAFPKVTISREIFVTRGDQKLDLDLLKSSEAGGKGLFTKELEDALLSGAIDVAVHSLKDLPGHQPAGLEVCAVLPRASTADVLVAREAEDFTELPENATIGTSSIRRARQLQWLRPDLQITDWRGNVQTRLRKLGENEAIAGIVLAQAGLERLGFAWLKGSLDFAPWKFRVSTLADHLFPAIGQGAIALQIRSDRPEIRDFLNAIDHRETHVAIRAERELQRLLAGDCSLPIGVRTRFHGRALEMRALLFGAAGEAPRTAEAVGSALEPEEVARQVYRGLCGS